MEIFENEKHSIKNLFPSYIDNTKFNYIKLDNIFSSSIIIYDYPKYISAFDITESLPKDIEYDMSIYTRKIDTYSVLKELTHYITLTDTEISTINKNQIDIDIIKKVKDDSKELRREIQINNEEIFLITIIITVFDKDKNNLLSKIKSIQSKLYSKQFISNIANFRHLDSYLLTLPLINSENNIIKNVYRNFTTTAISATFPFYELNVIDEKGIIFGNCEKTNSICCIDIFSNSYMNSNTCIFGSSGSGKSFLVKLLIVRNFFKGIKQYIFDPEGEYSYIFSDIKHDVISFSSCNENKYINIFDITEMHVNIYAENTINLKSKNISNFICNICDITEESEINQIYETILSTYSLFSITDVESLYQVSEENKIYINKKIKDSTQFPTFIDFIKEIKNSNLKIKITNEILNKYPIFSKHTNIDFNSSIIVFDLSCLDQNSINIISSFLFDIIDLRLRNNGILKNHEKVLIYIDEIWKFISNKISMEEKILSLFKSIRKKNAGIITITQDISDFFSYKSGLYGKGILNNSGFKIFFKTNYSDTAVLNNLSDMSSSTIDDIARLTKGQCKIIFKNNIVNINVQASDYERKLIEGGNK